MAISLQLSKLRKITSFKLLCKAFFYLIKHCFILFQKSFIMWRLYPCSRENRNIQRHSTWKNNDTAKLSWFWLQCRIQTHKQTQTEIYKLLNNNQAHIFSHTLTNIYIIIHKHTLKILERFHWQIRKIISFKLPLASYLQLLFI